MAWGGRVGVWAGGQDWSESAQGKGDSEATPCRGCWGLLELRLRDVRLYRVLACCGLSPHGSGVTGSFWHLPALSETSGHPRHST